MFHMKNIVLVVIVCLLFTAQAQTEEAAIGTPTEAAAPQQQLQKELELDHEERALELANAYASAMKVPFKNEDIALLAKVRGGTSKGSTAPALYRAFI